MTDKKQFKTWFNYNLNDIFRSSISIFKIFKSSSGQTTFSKTKVVQVWQILFDKNYNQNNSFNFKSYINRQNANWLSFDKLKTVTKQAKL